LQKTFRLRYKDELAIVREIIGFGCDSCGGYSEC